MCNNNRVKTHSYIIVNNVRRLHIRFADVLFFFLKRFYFFTEYNLTELAVNILIISFYFLIFVIVSVATTKYVFGKSHGEIHCDYIYIYQL